MDRMPGVKRSNQPAGMRAEPAGTRVGFSRNTQQPRKPVHHGCGLNPQGRESVSLKGPTVGGHGQLNRRDHDSRNAVVTGNRAARSAGNRPPMKPIASAHFRPVHSSAGETAKSNVSWPTPDIVEAV